MSHLNATKHLIVEDVVTLAEGSMPVPLFATIPEGGVFLFGDNCHPYPPTRRVIVNLVHVGNAKGHMLFDLRRVELAINAPLPLRLTKDHSLGVIAVKP